MGDRVLALKGKNMDDGSGFVAAAAIYTSRLAAPISIMNQSFRRDSIYGRAPTDCT
jgi:hypothetical protein